MDIQDLKVNYFIDEQQVDQLEKLGLLNNIPIQNGKRNFGTEDIQQLTEMIHLIHLGIDEKSLIQYFHYTSSQLEILNKMRISIIHEIHEFQKKLDDIDFMIYQRSDEQ